VYRFKNVALVQFILPFAVIGLSSCAQTQAPKATAVKKTFANKPEVLFDGSTLDGWELTSFGGEGDCYVEDGAIVLTAGDPVTAINLPEDYDLLIGCRWLGGNDNRSVVDRR